ncbi:phosphotransferase family protein [Nesterenkonia aurantiaca]|uniref:phosphotransferase family protein n=1 Tax=Nesterenkonia aurantiaca TaxID=1436010 RepID=UPI003EE81423
MEADRVRGDLLSVLRGAEAETLLRRALGASGLELRGWELEQVHARPGADSSARYRVQCAAPGGAQAGRAGLEELTELRVVASTVAMTPQQRSSVGAIRADSPHGRVHLWVHPVDPQLPGLLLVEHPAPSPCAEPGSTELESRLSGLLGEQCRLQSLQMLVLRPLRRAVYRAVVASERGERVLYLKVVRPARMTELLRRHSCSPLNPSVADAGDGILVLDQAPGLALTQHLYRGAAPGGTAPSGTSPTEIPAAGVAPLDPQVLITALETLRPETLELSPRLPPARRLDGLVESAITAGADSRRVQQLSSRIGAGLRERPGPLVPTHGDFHPANLFLDQTGRHPTGLIDADTTGPGYRVDDLATMLGHLLTLPSFDAQGYAAVPEFARRFHSHCLLHADRLDLGARTAAVLLSLLPGAQSADQREHHLHTAETLVERFSPEDPPR